MTACWHAQLEPRREAAWRPEGKTSACPEWSADLCLRVVECDAQRRMELRATLARTCLCSCIPQPYEQEPW